MSTVGSSLSWRYVPDENNLSFSNMLNVFGTADILIAVFDDHGMPHVKTLEKVL